ncbi:PHP domain-containing protein [Bacillus mangrovi]|uniref:PHP domain-containing protein n=1 Tax=Metabacillus mangrovi TaxID=1491830 RepID=A0A7X2V4I6_9BACI|nr:PHP domain-containing protein [Metabacillus mangrovi]MTH53068.1 PHP domain-containing protein [Metabacillus mangrovi]
MKIDFHVHAKLGKKVPFSLKDFLKLMEEAKWNGLDAIALTEHFNARDFIKIYQTLDRHYPYQSTYYDVAGIKVFPGMEVDIAEGGHILLIGSRSDIIRMTKRLETHKNKETYIPFDQLMSYHGMEEMLKIGAHPFREKNPLTRLTEEQLARLDAFEWNAKDVQKYGAGHWPKIEKMASSFKKPITAGSDTHHYSQIGAIYNRFEGSFTTVKQLKGKLNRQEFEIRRSPLLPLKVQAARALKKKYRDYR